MLSTNDSIYQDGLLNSTDASTTGTVDPTLIFGPQRDALYIVLPITVIYVIILVTGLLGNIFTCWVIIRNKSMHTATNYYLFSLAISDLLLLISGMPQEIYTMWSKWPYIFGPAFCLIRGLAAETSTNASVLTITLFTIERYLAICHPFQSYRMSKLSRATRHIVVLWIISMALALPQALQFGIRKHKGVIMCLQTRVIIDHSFEISTFLFFLTPMILITVLYLLIGIHLKQSTVGKHSIQTDQRHTMLRTDKLRRKVSQSTRRVVKMLVAVVVVFFLCWAPFHAQRLVAIYGTSEDHKEKAPGLLFVYSVLTYSSGVFYYMSTCINPILYHIMSHKFRGAFKNTMLRWCGAGKGTAVQRSSFSALVLQRNPTSSGTDSGYSIRNEASGFNKERRNHYVPSKPMKPEEVTTRVRISNQVYHPVTTEAINEDSKKGRRIGIVPLHDDCPNNCAAHLMNFRSCTLDSISNSSLKESKTEDLEDELIAYVKEIKLRVVLQQQKDNG